MAFGTTNPQTVYNFTYTLKTPNTLVVENIRDMVNNTSNWQIVHYDAFDNGSTYVHIETATHSTKKNQNYKITKVTNYIKPELPYVINGVRRTFTRPADPSLNPNRNIILKLL